MRTTTHRVAREWLAEDDNEITVSVIPKARRDASYWLSVLASYCVAVSIWESLTPKWEPLIGFWSAAAVSLPAAIGVGLIMQRGLTEFYRS